MVHVLVLTCTEYGTTLRYLADVSLDPKEVKAANHERHHIE